MQMGRAERSPGQKKTWRWAGELSVRSALKAPCGPPTDDENSPNPPSLPTLSCSPAISIRTASVNLRASARPSKMGPASVVLPSE